MKKFLFSGILIYIGSITFAQTEYKNIRQGNKMYDKENYEEAEVDYRKALEKKPESDKAQYNLAGALYKQEKYEDAATEYNILANTGKDSEETARFYHNLGNSYLQLGKLQESIEAYKNALRNNPSDDETRYNLAYALNKLQEQQQQQDQQKDQNQEQEQEQDQQQNQQQEQQEQQEQQQQEQQQPREQQISKEDAQRMLEALQQEEQELQKELKEKQLQSTRVYIEKDW